MAIATTLGSSKFAAAAGIHPYQSRAKLWRVLTGREQPNTFTARMDWGVQFETLAVAAVEARTGHVFQHTGPEQVTRQLGCWTSTPDGIDGRVGLEVKCPEKPYPEVPVYYVAQCQGQMLVCDLDEVVFSCWTPKTLNVWRIPKDEGYQRWLVNLLQEFMRFLNEDTEPPRLRKRPVPPEVKVETL